MSGSCFEVPPRSRKEIRQICRELRRLLHWEEAYFPIVELLEHVMPSSYPGFEFEVWDADEMGDNHGLTYPEKKLIVIRDDVYDRACDGHGRDRMTMAHELGHLLLHSNLALARRATASKIEAFRSSEWQANCFGGELLVSRDHLVPGMSARTVARAFGVSEQAAKYQLGIKK